jgi:Brp/Blh family beta-carotene 15,15'-monooxygenase
MIKKKNISETNIYNYCLALFVFSFVTLFLFIKLETIQDGTNLLIICFILILILGVSHGSLDPIKGEKILRPKYKNNWKVIFYVGYIFLSALVIFLWIKIPALTLLVFLIIASFHFGYEDLDFFNCADHQLKSLIAFMKGFLIILLSLNFQPETTKLFFNYLMVNENSYSFLNNQFNNLLILNISVLALGLPLLFKDNIKNLLMIKLETILTILAFIFLPLIAAFTFYFCFIHSSKHTLSLAKMLNANNIIIGLRMFVKKAIPLTLVVLVFAIVLSLNLNFSVSESIIKVIFIGLASLTLPHILLEIFEKK